MYLSIIWSICYTIRLIPLGIININELNVGNKICVYSGVKHLIWKLLFLKNNPLVFSLKINNLDSNIYKRINNLIKIGKKFKINKIINMIMIFLA